MIRVKVPLDLTAVTIGGSGAFALATPLRIRDILRFAIREALGTRAPADKFSRSVHRTLAGLAAGDFTIDINGRSFSDPDAVVVCERIADVRFFLSRRATLNRR
jgi:hypothetical protein